MSHRPASTAVQIDANRVSPPSSLLSLSEGWRAVLEASMLLQSMPFLRSMPRGDSHPVYLLPGFMADSQSTAVLGRWLNELGYTVIPWGFGRNLGPRGLLMERLLATVGDLAQKHGQQISLIGQSLGGVLAREIAKEIPKQIRQVISLGSPFRQTENGTAPPVMRLFELATGTKTHDLKRQMGDISRPASVPSTAIYSRTDGIADWKTCIEEETPFTDNVEVFASHCGMGFNPSIYYVIGDRLAQPADKWGKFERSGVRCLIYPDAVYAAATPPATRPCSPRSLRLG
jgi:pimeloyl-ACP methyl ester carboxylesterase